MLSSRWLLDTQVERLSRQLDIEVRSSKEWAELTFGRFQQIDGLKPRDTISSDCIYKEVEGPGMWAWFTAVVGYLGEEEKQQKKLRRSGH